MICVCRFLIPSTRNRHIARAHGKYGRRYDQDGEDGQGQEEFESGTFIGFSILFTNRVFRKLKDNVPGSKRVEKLFKNLFIINISKFKIGFCKNELHFIKETVNVKVMELWQSVWLWSLDIPLLLSHLQNGWSKKYQLLLPTVPKKYYQWPIFVIFGIIDFRRLHLEF